MSRARAVFLLLAALLSLGACASTPAPVVDSGGTPISAKPPEAKTGGISGEIRLLVEKGTPPSLQRALDLIRSRDLGDTEYGRAMTAVAVTLMKDLYPEIPAVLPVADPPATHSYSRILRDAEKGSYTPPSSSSTDYLEYVLPFLSLLNETRTDRFTAAVPDLVRAHELSADSVLDPWFRALSAERQGRPEEALACWLEATARSPDCYPASVGAARALLALGRTPEALALLSELRTRYPDNILVKKQLSLLYYQQKDWSRAGPAIAEILQRDSSNVQFLLIRAHILVEQGSFLQAQPLLDIVAVSQSATRLYLFLRSRIQAEGFHNNDSALTYLRSLLRTWPDDEEAQAYAARLLMDSPRAEERKEGRDLLARLLSSAKPSAATAELALKDAINRQAWPEAEKFAARLLEDRRGASDLRSALQVYVALKNRDMALRIAKELLELDPANDANAALYAETLILSGSRAEASRFIEERLPTLSQSTDRSRFYYLRSRLKSDEDAVMADLRSSLFENPRNLEALIAMFEIYRTRKEDRRAVYYLKQALAIAPDNPQLKRYQQEYAASLGSSF